MIEPKIWRVEWGPFFVTVRAANALAARLEAKKFGMCKDVSRLKVSLLRLLPMPKSPISEHEWR